MGERDPGFTLEVMLTGLRAARDRYNAAIRSRDAVVEAYCALFEALNWTSAVAERLTTERGEAWPQALGEGPRPAEVLEGLRFARNRVHHHWPDALVMRDGLSFPMRFPLMFFEWLWRDVLPPHPKADSASDRGREEYEKLLAGRPARISIEYVYELTEAALGRRRLADTHWAIED